MKKCGSCPLRCKTPGFPRVFRISANCFGFLCLSMHVHACKVLPPVELTVLCAALVSRPVSRQSRLSIQDN
jgi:hypothetical protein